MPQILCVVEGRGEVSAAPVLIRRLLHEKLQRFDINVVVQRREGIDHLRASSWGNFQRYLEVAYLENCPILWMLDCEDDCPLNLMQLIALETRKSTIRQPIAFVLWYREFETMFLFDRNALSSWADLDLECPESPQTIRGAKEWISKHLPVGKAYKETLDQVKLVSRLNITLLEQNYCDFEHLVNTLVWLLDPNNSGIYPGFVL